MTDLLKLPELLREVEEALSACWKAFLTVEHNLTTPYSDDPRWSPWTRWAEPAARKAHDAAMKLRRELQGVPSASGEPS